MGRSRFRAGTVYRQQAVTAQTITESSNGKTFKSLLKLADLRICEASRFDSNSNRPSYSIRFERDWPIRKFPNRIGHACPLLVVSLIKRFKRITVLIYIAAREGSWLTLTSCSSLQANDMLHYRPTSLHFHSNTFNFYFSMSAFLVTPLLKLHDDLEGAPKTVVPWLRHPPWLRPYTGHR